MNQMADGSSGSSTVGVQASSTLATEGKFQSARGQRPILNFAPRGELDP
jgi:hypothetical protein